MSHSLSPSSGVPSRAPQAAGPVLPRGTRPGQGWDAFLAEARDAVASSADALGGDRSRAVRALADALAARFGATPARGRDRAPRAALGGPARAWLERWTFVSSDQASDARRRRLGPEAMARFHEAFAGGEGCVYTERGDVRFMARRALAEHLAASHPEGAALPRDKAFRLVGASPGTIARQAARLTAGERRAARARLRTLRALDPACGAGAFLVGLLEEIVRLGRALGADSPEGVAARAVSENLFGVDVDPHAVGVTRRRLAAAVSGASPALAVGDVLRLDWPRVFPSLAQVPGGGREVRGTAQAGFDLVIGNPPYLRQERIDRQGRLGPGTKRATWEAARRRWGRDLGISRRADLYVYFFLEALRLLRPGGALVFLTSHAWLDLDYGAALRAFLLEEADLPLILESDHRAFRRASVNTIVTVALRRPNGAPLPGAGWPPGGRLSTSRQRRSAPGTPRPRSPVCFARLHRSLARASEGPLFIALDGQRDREDAALRMRRASPRDLAPAAPAHAAPRWGGLWLRGPAVIFRVRERSAGRTVPLGEIAEVVFGLKTGCNAFFYLDDAGPVSGALHRCRSRLDGGHHLIEARFLSPIVTTLKEVDGLSVAPDRLRRRLLTIPPGADLEGTHAAAYLRVGERHGVHRHASLASRRSWFSLAPPRGAFLIPRRVGERMPVVRTLGVPFDNNLFGITPRPGVPAPALQAVLNATITRLHVEIGARDLTGAQAVVDTNVYLVKELPVPRPDLLRAKADELSHALADLAARRARSIFDELGARDRGALDACVLSLWGIPGREIAAVQEAVADLVRRRLAKAAGRSLPRKLCPSMA